MSNRFTIQLSDRFSFDRFVSETAEHYRKAGFSAEIYKIDEGNKEIILQKNRGFFLTLLGLSQSISMHFSVKSGQKTRMEVELCDADRIGKILGCIFGIPFLLIPAVTSLYGILSSVSELRHMASYIQRKIAAVLIGMRP